MAQVKLRFYGRFVYAEAVREGRAAADRISVLAPNFDQQLYGRHQVLMSVQRGQVIYGNQATTFEPSMRMASDAPIYDAELMVWDVAGCQVTYGLSSSPVELVPHTGDVLALPKLESLRGRSAELDRRALRASRQGLSNAVIELSAGHGVATPVLDQAKVLLSTAAAAQDSWTRAQDTVARDPETDEQIETLPADLVEFSVPLPDGQRALTLCFAQEDGPTRRVTVREGTTVVFTNLCTRLEAPRKFDLEFLQYYSLLEGNPGLDALIPIEAASGAGGPGPLAEGEDCDIQARIQYDPSLQ